MIVYCIKKPFTLVIIPCLGIRPLISEEIVHKTREKYPEAYEGMVEYHLPLPLSIKRLCHNNGHQWTSKATLTICQDPTIIKPDLALKLILTFI